MPGWDITRLRNKWAATAFLLLTFVIWAGTQLQVSAQSQTDGSQTEPKPDSKPPSDQSAAPGGAANSQPQDTQQKTNDNGGFIFRKDEDEVLLHATVVDDKQHLVKNLDKTA